MVRRAGAGERLVAACRQEHRRARAGWAPFWRYLALGRYGEQLQLLYTVFPPEQVLLLRYRDLREEPTETLDIIFDFLGVATGRVREVPAENVTTHATPSPWNRTVSGMLRAGSRLDGVLPAGVWGRTSDYLARHLQREQHLRWPIQPGQREPLLPAIADDVRVLEELTGDSFADWVDADRAHIRRSLPVRGRVGTAHNSIDKPLDRSPTGVPPRRSA